MSYSKKELADYRIERALESVEEAKILAAANYWNTAVSRLYYACFYSASAYLISSDILAGTHTGVKTAFNRVLIKTSVLPKSYGIMYSKLFNLRQDADYRDFRDFSADEIIPLIEIVEDIVARMTELIQENNSSS